MGLTVQVCKNSGSWDMCLCKLEVLHRAGNLPYRCASEPGLCFQILMGRTVQVCTNSCSWHVCRCMLEGLHRAGDLPHQSVSSPGFCSQILMGLTVQGCTNSGSWDVFRCMLEGRSPQGCRSPLTLCQQARFLLSDSDGSDSPGMHKHL